MGLSKTAAFRLVFIEPSSVKVLLIASIARKSRQLDGELAYGMHGS
jgi:hypothetical protein